MQGIFHCEVRGFLILALWLAQPMSRGEDVGKQGRSYKTAAEIKAMPACRAGVTARAPCYVVLTCSNGVAIRIGSPGNTPELDGFLGFLKDGKSYKFPDAFLEYERSLPKYRMELVAVLDTEPQEKMFVIVFSGGGFAFRTVEALKKFVGTLPRNSILEWAPGCERDAHEPLLSSEQEMSAFRQVCRENRINFVLVPSG